MENHTSYEMNPDHELTNKVFIREFKPEDKESVWAVNLEALKALGIPIEKIDRSTEYRDFDHIEETYIQKGGNFLVMELDGRIVAFGGYFPIKRKTAVIRRMRVLPDYQGKGLGKRMLLALEDDIKKRGLKRIQLGTSTLMKKAIGLYESMGYQRVKTTLRPDKGFGGDYAEILYKKELG